MHRILLAAALSAATAAPTLAEGFLMGAGRWTCERARAAFITQNATDQAQVAGWILGYWSAVSFTHEKPFIDKMQEVGGQKVVEITLAECQKNPNALLYHVSAAIEANTAKETGGSTGEGTGEPPAAE